MRNHIRISSQRDTPSHILEGLRSIDPAMDLHYIGEGRWALGSVRWTRPREIEAAKLLGGGHLRTAGAQRLAELGLYGFAKIATYDIMGEPTSEITNDFRQRDYRYRADRERLFNEKLTESQRNDAGWEVEDMLSEIEAREADSYANFFRGRRSFDMGKQRVQ